MTLKDSIQTAFLVVSIFTILIFGASYYFMFLDADPTDQPLKDSLTITASFFGGFATLTAAYIASKLFNDWKLQHNKNIESQICKDIIDFSCNTSMQLLHILSDVENFVKNKDTSENAFLALLSVKNKLDVLRDGVVTTLGTKLNLIATEEDYKTNFFPAIDSLTSKLELYSFSLNKVVNKEVYKNDASYEAFLYDLRDGIKDFKNQVDYIVKLLKPYYKALT